MLQEEIGVNLSSDFVLLYPSPKIELRLTRNRTSIFYMYSDNANVFLENDDCSLTVDVFLWKMIMKEKNKHAWIYYSEYNFFDNLTNMFAILARQNGFKPEIIFKKAPFCLIAVARNEHFGFTGLFTENPFW